MSTINDLIESVEEKFREITNYEVYIFYNNVKLSWLKVNDEFKLCREVCINGSWRFKPLVDLPDSEIKLLLLDRVGDLHKEILYTNNRMERLIKQVSSKILEIINVS